MSKEIVLFKAAATFKDASEFHKGWNVGVRTGPSDVQCVNSPWQTFETLSCDRQRIMCMMWVLLSRHKFTEAAELMVYAIHNYTLSPSWIWRATYQIFNCMKVSISSEKFNKVLNQFHMTDENNRNLETLLSQMVGGNWKAAIDSRLDNNPSRRVQSTDRCREPESLHVQRLHRLYEGLAYFALWFLNRERPAGSKYLEKAEYRLSEVETLIEFGHIGDVFLLPLVQIHFDKGCAEDILPLLEKYASLQPHNPNTDRFLAEWHLYAAIGHTVLPRDPNEFRRIVTKSLTLHGVSIPPLLKHLVAFSLRLLPTPASSDSVRGDGNWYFIIADICRASGFFTQALEIAFKLLDHPSWCKFDQPWRLLQTCVQKLGATSDFVSKMWTPRAATWKHYIFSHPDLSPEGVSANKLLKSVPLLEGGTYQMGDYFGCILEVTPLKH
ncbi:expressed conserved protein [Echinococcus multilocularis]|uniref:Expressed conserved protein n=1 Tax=Echinococcus multilocularis TaxID=6211 RepID=A0A087VWY7_ECHMU|nr:expressed conserved protein [Echinococcus multilocularis]